ncbi:MAG: peptidylprolyl isomerase [Syntrophomonas sp.]|nr:peptidylprolyl isomerase [Syntrophomonas sp.]
MNKRIILAMAFILLLLAAGCNSQKQASPNIATVNGEGINQSEFDMHYNLIKTNLEQQQGVAFDEAKDKELIDRIKSATYDDLIVQKIIRQEAKKQGVTVSSEEVDSVLNQFKESKNSTEVDGYKKFLDTLQMTEGDLRLQIETSQLYEKLQEKTTGEIKVSDTDAQNYYNENQIMFKDPGGIQIFHILVDSEQLASEIIVKLKQGDDFAALAQQYSSDPGSKDRGGDVGPVNESTNFVPEFKQAALALQPGQLNPQPIKSDFGYHIIKAGDKKDARQLSFAEVKDSLKVQMEMEQRNKAFETYLEELKNKADIKDLRQK